MPEIGDHKQIFSLLEVTTSIQRTLVNRYRSVFWVKAEMNKLNYYPHSGHCYPDLVDKVDGKVVAQLKSTLWKDDYMRINGNFLKMLQSPLKDGIKILFCAKITFDPIHGLSLRIVDVDPVFSLGELEREKQESIALLKKEGVYDQNRSLSFPLIPQRMAVISVQTSKGYADFLKVIEGNPWGYRFFHVLFPSLLQGDKAVESIGRQLNRIRKVSDHFDVVAIIRGGGGDVGLSCFNDYRLARQIALFPIPVITGIGHATNETVVEMVAYRNAITPTELADFLLQKFHNFSIPVQRAEEVLLTISRRILSEERQKFKHLIKYFQSAADHVIVKSRHEIGQQGRELFKQSHISVLKNKHENSALLYKLRGFSLSQCVSLKQEIGQTNMRVRKGIASFLKQEKGQFESIVRSVANMHPENVLRRGYAIARINGKILTSINQVKPGDIVHIHLGDGVIASEARTTKKSPEI